MSIMTKIITTLNPKKRLFSRTVPTVPTSRKGVMTKKSVPAFLKLWNGFFLKNKCLKKKRLKIERLKTERLKQGSLKQGGLKQGVLRNV